MFVKHSLVSTVITIYQNLSSKARGIQSQIIFLSLIKLWISLVIMPEEFLKVERVFYNYSTAHIIISFPSDVIVAKLYNLKEEVFSKTNIQVASSFKIFCQCCI